MKEIKAVDTIIVNKKDNGVEIIVPGGFPPLGSTIICFVGVILLLSFMIHLNAYKAFTIICITLHSI